MSIILKLIKDDYFKKTQQEKDELLAPVANQFLQTCISRGMGYTEVIEELECLIDAAVNDDYYELADALLIMKTELINAMHDYITNENGL